MTLQQEAPEWLNKAYIQDVMIRSGYKEPTFNVNDIKIIPGSSAGDNYVCQIFRISINYGKYNETISIIGKYKPGTTALNTKIEEIIDVYGNEARFLTETISELKHLRKLEKEIAPHAFHADPQHQIIFMEDLSTKDFYMQPRGKFLSCQQAVLVLEALANLHGASYYLLQKDPNLKQVYNSKFWSEQRNEAIYSSFASGHIALDRFVNTYGFSDEWCSKLRGLKTILSRDWFKVCNLQEGKLNFLLHGDSWMNNMLFHDSGAVVDDVRLLDFQIVYYNSFANDLQYFIFSSVEAKVIVNELDFLLETYYNKLKQIAPDIPNLTLRRVKDEFSERFFIGLVFTVMFRSFIVCEVKPDVNDLMEEVGNILGFNNPRYVEELRSLLPLFEKVGVF